MKCGYKPGDLPLAVHENQTDFQATSNWLYEKEKDWFQSVFLMFFFVAFTVFGKGVLYLGVKLNTLRTNCSKEAK